MPSFAELGFAKEQLDEVAPDVANLPEQMGMRPKTLQPGPYIFQLPPRQALAAAVEKIEKTADRGERLSFVFRDAAALTVVQAPNKELNGTSHHNRISNVARKRGNKDDSPKVSDLDYLLVALGEKALPKTNAGYYDALLKYAGKTFKADIEFGYYCNAKKEVRVMADDGTTVKLDGLEGRDLRKGCNARVYQKDVEKNDDGTYPEKIQCECGAVLYAGENLGRFVAAAPQAKPAAAPATS